ncbi:DUF4147 domain-containing protein, partial [Vibrio vulnificus]|uniref:DUF4147 domain-containing protein n=1 Tax=Vibrio vulnificus TaxID=672 RepID=UPI0019D43B47
KRLIDRHNKETLSLVKKNGPKKIRMSREWLRTATQAIFKAAVEASKPDEAVRRYVKCSADELVVGDTRLKVPRRALVVGFGKASALMASAL